MQKEIINILIGSTVVIFLLITVIVTALLINQKRKFRHRQQLENQKKAFQQEILQTQLEIQNQTFENVSRELHDNVSNTLSLVLLNLNLIGDGFSPENTTRMEASKTMLLEAKDAVKDFSWHINPENIGNMGLSTSLNQLGERFSKLKFNVTFSTEGSEFCLESSHHVVIYRIIQEAFSNIVKHSSCNEVKLGILFQYPQVVVSIQDNGRGFDLQNVLSANHETHSSGLKNMIARAKMINANLEIQSAPGNGTSVSLSCHDGAKIHDKSTS